MRLPDTLARLRTRLDPIEPDSPSEQGATRQSAVLVVLFPRADALHFVLTKRPSTLSRHPGQISLPGGVREESDPSLWATAIREAGEEIGLRPGRLVPLGRLDAYHLRVSQYLIHPFVAWNPVAPRFHVQEREVEELIEVPFEWLFDRDAVREETWELRGDEWLVTFYRFGERNVWGATAHILADLAERLQGGDRVTDRRPGSVRKP
jgi:8-oxo-dGTP pyrophosphatase MutT (NUDIX family)